MVLGWSANTGRRVRQALGVHGPEPSVGGHGRVRSRRDIGELVADGRRLAGERIPRCNDSLTTRPLSEEEAKRVRSFADRGQLFFRRAVIVALAFAGGTSSEIAKVRKSHVDLKTGTVTVGGRQNPLCKWGQQTIHQFLQIRPLIHENRLLAVNEQIDAHRRAHAVTVRLGEVIADAGLRGTAGVSARSVRLYYQPLRRTRTQIKKPGKRTRKHIVYTQWEIPDHPVVSQHMIGAITWLRNNSTPQERQAKRHTRRTRALRPIPETDPLFEPLYGIRQDIESHFSTYKRQLDYDRLRTQDKNSLKLNWITYCLYQTNTALVAHHARTGKDMTRWHGNHFPNARAGPLEKAA